KFYDVCKDLGLEGNVIAHHSSTGRLVEGRFDIQHRPMLFQWARGPLYHVGQYWFNSMAVWMALRHRCDLIVTTSGSHLLPFWLAKAFRKHVVLSEHCVLWPKIGRVRGLGRFVQYLDGY